MVRFSVIPYCGVSFTKNTEILACKIARYMFSTSKDQKIILNLDPEGWDIVNNGLEQCVKNICDELRIDYSKIEFRSNDRLCKSRIFKHTINKRNIRWWSILCKRQTKNIDIKLPTKFDYSLFCGRATNERLYSFWKHKNWQYSNRGKASMHLDLSTVSEQNNDFNGFICEHNSKWRSLIPMLPYSDTGETIDPTNLKYEEVVVAPDIWDKVYNDIAIEVVCETNTTADTFFVTEKTFRPIAYGRLFLVIGSPKFEQNLKTLGFDIFDDIIDKTYDIESSYLRIDAVFKSLEKLLQNPVDMQSILQRLEANKTVLENL